MADLGGGIERDDGRGHLCDGFLDKLSGLINKDNVDLILSEQEDMLETLEVANEKLSSLNNFSEKCFGLHVAEFRTYTQTLTNMKKDLDSVFRRIRIIKTKLAMQYPAEYSEAQATLQTEFDNEEEDDDR